MDDDWEVVAWEMDRKDNCTEFVPLLPPQAPPQKKKTYQKSQKIFSITK